MSVGNDQREFSLLIAKLMVWVYEQGYEITVGDFWANDGHSYNSFHYSRRAADLNLFKDKVWLTETEDHRFIGDKWKSMHPKCIWGGDFNKEDGNHYSFGESSRF